MATCIWCDNAKYTRDESELHKLCRRFIRAARKERALRKREKVRAHTPDLDHFGLQMHRVHMVPLLLDDTCRRWIQQSFNITPLSCPTVPVKAEDAEARIAEIQHGKGHTRTAGNSVAVSEYRKGDLSMEGVVNHDPRTLLDRKLGMHKSAIASPYGVVWHARYIARHGRFYLPAVIVQRGRIPFLADGNHRFLGALLATEPATKVSLITLRRTTETATDHEHALW